MLGLQPGLGMLVALCGEVSEGCTDPLTAGTFRPAEHTRICEKVGGVPAPGLVVGAEGVECLPSSLLS